MTAAERGLVLLCCALGDQAARPLTMAQFRELSSRVQTAQRQGAPDDQVDEALLERLGYSGEMAQRMVYLLSREARLETYLEEALEVGCYPVTRISPSYPQVLIQKRGASRPPVFFCAGNERLLKGPFLSVAGARRAGEAALEFAGQLGRLAARTGRILVTGGAAGVDWAAADACLRAGGSTVAMIPDALFDRAHLAGEHHLLCSEGGYDLSFTTPRAMMRNSYIHQMGEQTVVVQAAFGKGGTWHGAVENLCRRWSPLYVFDDGSAAAQALVQQGAVPIRDVMALDHDA